MSTWCVCGQEGCVGDLTCNCLEGGSSDISNPLPPLAPLGQSMETTDVRYTSRAPGKGRQSPHVPKGLCRQHNWATL